MVSRFFQGDNAVRAVGVEVVLRDDFVKIGNTVGNFMIHARFGSAFP